jgi:hypothetical protein
MFATARTQWLHIPRKLTSRGRPNGYTRSAGYCFASPPQDRTLCSRRGKPGDFRWRTTCQVPNGNRHDRSKSTSRSFRKIWRRLWTQVPAGCFDAYRRARYMLLSSVAPVLGTRQQAGSTGQGRGGEQQSPKILDTTCPAGRGPRACSFKRMAPRAENAGIP